MPPTPIEETPSACVYRISPLRRALLWLCLGPLALIGLALWIFGGGSDRTAGMVVFGLMVVLLALWQWFITRTRIELTDKGVRLYQFAMYMETTWSNIESISTERGHEGFITKSALASKGAGRLSGLRDTGPYHEDQREFMRQRRWIPIEPFGWYLRRGSLAKDIARLAPHLCDALSEAKLNAPRPPIFTSRRSGAIVIGVIVGAIALGFAVDAAPDSWQRWFSALLWSILTPVLALQFVLIARTRLQERSWFAFWLYGLAALFFSLFTIIAWIELARLLQ